MKKKNRVLMMFAVFILLLSSVFFNMTINAATVQQLESSNEMNFKVETVFSPSKLVQNQMLTAKVTATDISYTPFEGMVNVLVIVGLYDESNTMVNISYISKGIAYGGTETLSAGFKLPAADLTGFKAKAFMWDGDDIKTTNMIPLSNVVQIPDDSVVTPLPTVSPTASATPAVSSTPRPSVTPTTTMGPSNPPSGTLAAYSLAGFSAGNTGGGNILETDPGYIKVYTAAEFVKALSKGSTAKVIEIMNDLNLGWNEIPADAQVSPMIQHAVPQTHPVLKQTGVSQIYIQDKSNLTIFSAKGAKIKHIEFDIKRCTNLIIRNLEFDELWEWDEATKGNYDKNDWDFITVEGASSKVWIDHCTFGKAYDGVVDAKGGASGITISWCKFNPADQTSGGFYEKQFDVMEASQSSYPMYSFLKGLGLTKKDIMDVSAPQKKTHLVGATEFDSNNAKLSITLHHNYYKDSMDRMPRLRAGNAHVCNIVMDSADAWAAKKKITSAMDSSITLKGYHFGVISNGALSTEGGAVLVEKCDIIDVFYPLRNNQVDPAKADYTGKIKAVDTMYSIDGTTFRGSSDISGSPLAPKPAPVLDFSWNGFSSLPYSYTADDPSTLKARLLASDGAGAGKLTWAKLNWLKTSY